MPTPSRKKGKTSPKSSTSTVIEGGITSPNVLRKKCKKLVLVLTTSTSITVAREKALRDNETEETGENSENGRNEDENLRTNLVQIPCIQYPIIFQKQSVSAFFDLKRKVNTIYPNFVKELGLPIISTDIGA